MRRTNFYLEPEKLRALKMIAANEDASVSDLVREAIDEVIAKRVAKPERVTSNGSPSAPVAATLLDDVLRSIDSNQLAISQEEIERDVAAAVGEARTERRARRRRAAAATPANGNE